MSTNQLFRELTRTRDQISRVERLLSLASNEQAIVVRLEELRLREATYDALARESLVRDKVREIARRCWEQRRREF